MDMHIKIDFFMSQTNNAFNPADLLTTFNGTSIAPVDGFDPNRPDVFIALFHSISSFLAMIGNPLAETHRGNATFYRSILDHLRGFQTSLSLYCRVMEGEAPLYQDRQNQVRAHRIGEIQGERRKRTYQQMEEKQSKRDELLKKLKTSPKVHHSHHHHHHHHHHHIPPPPPPGTGPSAFTSACFPTGMHVA
jgi:hypothetical protein